MFWFPTLLTLIIVLLVPYWYILSTDTRQFLFLFITACNLLNCDGTLCTFITEMNAHFCAYLLCDCPMLYILFGKDFCTLLKLSNVYLSVITILSQHVSLMPIRWWICDTMGGLPSHRLNILPIDRHKSWIPIFWNIFDHFRELTHSLSQSAQVIYTLCSSTLAQLQYGYHHRSRTPCL